MTATTKQPEPATPGADEPNGDSTDDATASRRASTRTAGGGDDAEPGRQRPSSRSRGSPTTAHRPSRRNRPKSQNPRRSRSRRNANQRDHTKPRITSRAWRPPGRARVRQPPMTPPACCLVSGQRPGRFAVSAEATHQQFCMWPIFPAVQSSFIRRICFCARMARQIVKNGMQLLPAAIASGYR